MGFENVYIEPSQAVPDGHFPTCPYPNPENPDAWKLALELAKEDVYKRQIHGCIIHIAKMGSMILQDYISIILKKDTIVDRQQVLMILNLSLIHI